MENLTNRNPTAYTGNEIIDRREYSLAPYITKFVSIRSAEERVEGGLVLYLGDNGKEYDFELESIRGGESIRRQFLDDIGVWDIFDNIWDIDYKSLIGKKLEAFVDRKKDCVVAVSPIFIPFQNEPERNLRTEIKLESIFSEKLKKLKSQDSEINITKYKNPAGVLFHLRKYVQDSVREALALKRVYMQLGDKTEAPESYYEFVNEAARVLEEANKKLKSLKPRNFGLGGVLGEIRGLNDSDEDDGNNPELNTPDDDPFLDMFYY